MEETKFEYINEKIRKGRRNSLRYIYVNNLTKDEQTYLLQRGFIVDCIYDTLFRISL